MTSVSLVTFQQVVCLGGGGGGVHLISLLKVVEGCFVLFFPLVMTLFICLFLFVMS